MGETGPALGSSFHYPFTTVVAQLQGGDTLIGKCLLFWILQGDFCSIPGDPKLFWCPRHFLKVHYLMMANSLPVLGPVKGHIWHAPMDWMYYIALKCLQIIASLTRCPGMVLPTDIVQMWTDRRYHWWLWVLGHSASNPKDSESMRRIYKSAVHGPGSWHCRGSYISGNSSMHACCHWCCAFFLGCCHVSCTLATAVQLLALTVHNETSSRRVCLGICAHPLLSNHRSTKERQDQSTSMVEMPLFAGGRFCLCWLLWLPSKSLSIVRPKHQFVVLQAILWSKVKALG